jgi:protein TonB
VFEWFPFAHANLTKITGGLRRKETKSFDIFFELQIEKTFSCSIYVLLSNFENFNFKLKSLKNLFPDNWNSIFSKTRNDFVFEKRNKDYGAYFLRQGYFKTLIRSYLAAIVIILIMVYTPVIVNIIDELLDKNILTEKEIAELAKSSDIELSPPPEIQLDIKNLPAIPNIIIQKKDSVIHKPKEIILNKDSILKIMDSTLLAMKESLHNDSIKRWNDSLAIAAANAQNDIINNHGSLQMKVDKMPEYPGGELAMNKYVKDHLRFSLRAKAMNTMGAVNVEFVVEADGSLSHIKMLMSAGNGLDEEVIKLINGMPHWKPGMRRGKPQRFLINLPVNFILRGK